MDNEEPPLPRGTVIPLTRAHKQVSLSATFASLRNRDFRLFAIGMLVSFVALQMQSLAQNYLVYQLTDLASAIGYVSAASGLSILIFSFAGGIAADRLEKRNLMAFSQLGIALFTLVLGILISTKLIQVWHIVATSIIMGIIAAFNMPARQSFVPDLVGEKNLTNALALNSSIMNLTRVFGPALAGVLIGLIGVGPLFYVKAVAYGFFVAMLFFIPSRGRASPSGRSVLSDAADGFRYLRRDRKVLDLLILGMVPTVFGTPYINFLPVFQKKVFDVGPSGLGLMMSVVGVGAIAGSLSIAVLSEHPRKGRILLGSGLGFGITLILFAITARMGNFPLSLAMLALVGITGTAFMALNNALVQFVVPQEMRGRVMGILMTTFGLTSLGAVPMGTMVDAIGAPLTTGLFGTITLGFILLMIILRPGLRQL